jgi:hypothetical protein
MRTQAGRRADRSLVFSFRIARAMGVVLACLTSALSANPIASRRVSDVLSELRSAGFVFIYSTSTIPNDLRVATEPAATAGLELAREILAPHGLGLREAAPKVYAVVREAPSSVGVSHASTVPAAPIERVIVQTSRYVLTNDYAAPSTFLSQDQFKDLPQLAGETLRSVQRLPGSATNGFSSVGPIRGGSPDEIAIILDGLRLYEPFHLKNFLNPVSLLDSRLIEGMEFYSGGFPAVHGDRMSAIIDARSIRPGQPRYAEIGLNLFHFSALGSMSFADERGHALLSYRRSNLGALVQFSEKDFGEPNYQDAFGRVDFALTDRTDASLQFLVSSDTITAKRANEMHTAEAHYQNVYAWGTVDHAWSDALSSRAIVSYTNLQNDRQGRIDEPTRIGTVLDDRIFHVVGLRWENSLDAGLLQHRFGVEGRRLWGAYDYASDVSWSENTPFPGSPAMRQQRRLSPDPHGFEAQAYWDIRADLSERWSVQGGARVDTQTYDGSDDGAQWSPRLSVLYTATPTTRVRVSWGRFYQAHAINELQVEDGLDQFHPAQFSDQLIVGVDQSFDTGLDLRIEAYRKRYHRVSPRFENMFDPLSLFPEAEFDRVMIDPSTAHGYGFEALLRLRPHGPWSGWVGYAWSQAADRIDGADVPRSWDQRHAINLGIVWSKGPWNVSLANGYHSGWPTTLLTLDPTSPTPRVSTQDRNRLRLNAYNSLDLRVTRVFALSRGVLDVFAEVTNATSSENACCTEYEVVTKPDGSVSYRAEPKTWLPLVPNVGILWRY